MGYRLTPEADEDAIDIYADSITLFGLRQAEQYRDGLLQCFALLASQPQMARQRMEFDPPFRAHAHGSHVIAYIETGSDILILRIFHARRYWPNLL